MKERRCGTKLNRTSPCFVCGAPENEEGLQSRSLSKDTEGLIDQTAAGDSFSASHSGVTEHRSDRHPLRRHWLDWPSEQVAAPSAQAVNGSHSQLTHCGIIRNGLSRSARRRRHSPHSHVDFRARLRGTARGARTASSPTSSAAPSYEPVRKKPEQPDSLKKRLLRIRADFK